MALTTTLEKKQNKQLSTSIAGKNTVEEALSALDTGKSSTSHTHNYAGSDSAGGAANSAKKLTNTTAIGSTIKPVYFTDKGVPAACTYSLSKDVPSDAVFTDTHYTTKLYVTGSTGTANAQTSNGATHLRLFDNDTNRASIKITGTGATKVSSDSNGVITINSTDNNTTYTAGTGLSLANNKFSLKTATASEIGGVKSSTTGKTANRDYNVQVNADGTMKVNVPWTDTHLDINDINYDSGGTINVGSLDINNGITFNTSGTIQELMQCISPASDVIRRSINLVFTSVKQSGNALGKVNSLMMTANISKTSNSDSAEYLLVGYFKVTVSSNDRRIYKLYIGLSNNMNGYQCDAFKCELYGTF